MTAPRPQRGSGRGPRRHGDAAMRLADDLASHAARLRLRKGRGMTASTTDYYRILGLTSDATLADVKKAYRKLARQHHPDRNNADPGAIDRFRRITEAYEYLSAHLKDNANGNGHSRPGATAPPRADVGMPGEYSEAVSLLTMLEETWQAIRARHPEIPPVVIIIASGTTGREARWGRFDSQRWTVHTTGTLTKILLIQTTPVTPIQGWYGVRRLRPRAAGLPADAHSEV
jgi:hypothetical protein